MSRSSSMMRLRMPVLRSLASRSSYSRRLLRLAVARYFSRASFTSARSSFLSCSLSRRLCSSSWIRRGHSRCARSSFLSLPAVSSSREFLSAIFSASSRLRSSMLLMLEWQILRSDLNLSSSISMDLLSIFSFSTSCRLRSLSWKRRLFSRLALASSFLRLTMISSSSPFSRSCASTVSRRASHSQASCSAYCCCSRAETSPLEWNCVLACI